MNRGWLIPAAAAALFVVGCSFDPSGLAPIDDAQPNSYQCACECAEPSATREVSISTGADDAEELLSTGAVNLTSTDLEMTEEAGPQLVGLRFVNVGLPPGAVITSARVQFTADQATSIGTNLLIEGQPSNSAPAFTTTVGNLSGRARTTASVPWSPGAWNTVGEAGAAQQTPELATLLQELVNQAGWTPDSPVVLLISGSGHRVAVSQDGNPLNAARLEVTFQTPPTVVTLQACVPAELNPNDGGNPALTEAAITADCEGRVETTVSGLAGACGYPSSCTCAATLTEPARFAATCDQPCVGEPVNAECTNFDPVGGVVTATHAGSDTPVCITSSPLSAGMFGQQSACDVSGTATVVADDESKTTDTEGRLEFRGGPCPETTCQVGLRYWLDLEPITYDSLFSSATFEDLAGVGHSLPGGEASLSSAGLGVFPIGGTHNTARGRRGSDSLGVVGANGDVINVSLTGGSGPACSLGGALVGAVDPELKRCENAGPSAHAICEDDSGCVDHEDCSDGDCNCVQVTSAGVTLSLAVSGPVVNQPPVANAGADQVVECNLPGRARLALTSSNSDPDGNLAQVRWLLGSRAGPTVGFTPVATVEQAVGTSSSYLMRAIDTWAQADEDASRVQVVDTTPPQLACNAPATLLPLDPVLAFTATATDVCDAAVVAEITSVRCYRINGAGQEVDTTRGCKVEVSGSTLTVGNTVGVGNHIRWTTRAFDDTGNMGTATCELQVVRP